MTRITVLLDEDLLRIETMEIFHEVSKCIALLRKEGCQVAWLSKNPEFSNLLQTLGLHDPDNVIVGTLGDIEADAYLSPWLERLDMAAAIEERGWRMNDFPQGGHVLEERFMFVRSLDYWASTYTSNLKRKLRPSLSGPSPERLVR